VGTHNNASFLVIFNLIVIKWILKYTTYLQIG